jgi:uncharacterized membrane protein
MENVTDILQSLFRWIHVVAGITWIGLLYFFNWINGAFAKTMDAETKKKVVPELLPRTLFWFRWGAAYTWITGVLLLSLVYYHSKLFLADPVSGSWSLPVIVMVLFSFLGVFVYDALYKSALAKNQYKLSVGVGFAIIVGTVWLMAHWAGFGYRGYVIHTGVLFGTIMAYNVWFRIWPAQQKIIMAIKNGEAPDAGLVALAGLRSRHNTYLSVPLVWAMLNVHTTYFSSCALYFLGAILIGWHIVYQLYKKSAKVPGF